MRDSGELTGVLGVSTQATAVRKLVAKAAKSSDPLVLLGEPGTGKQFLAQLIHEASSRTDEPFLMIDCSLYYERELLRELFGFSGSGKKPARKGLLEFAHKGTCYLSRVEELAIGVQLELRRFLETGQFARLGDGRTVASGVRLIVSTERNLDGFVEAGLFDKELFAALSGMRHRLAPLRERREDVSWFVEQMRLDFLSQNPETAAVCFASETLDALGSYPWPLNLDELKSEVQRLLEKGGGEIRPERLSMEIANYWFGQSGDPDLRAVLEELDGHIREFRVMSRLNTEFGGIAEFLETDGSDRNCYRNMMEGA